MRRPGLPAVLAVLQACAASGTLPVDAGAPDAGRDAGTLPRRSLFPAGKWTGERCRSDDECAPSLGSDAEHGVCQKRLQWNRNGVRLDIDLPEGMCQSPCTYDAGAIGSSAPECPSETAMCVPTGGGRAQCWQFCQQALDCAPGWVCAPFVGRERGACLPPEVSECDPPGDPRPQNRHCDDAGVCVSYSGDNSAGLCEVRCNPVLQDCPFLPGFSLSCIVDLASVDGTGYCVEAGRRDFDQACDGRNDCQAGLECIDGRCRLHCRDGGVPRTTKGVCPPRAPRCEPIWWTGGKVQFTTDQTGVCR